MPDPTLEFKHVATILAAEAEAGRITVQPCDLDPEEDSTIRIELETISRLAAPLEAANARIRELEGELTRLRQIEADARKAGQITRDGKFAKINGSVWHPNEDCMGAVRVHPCGSPQWADFLHIDDWDIHYNKVTSHPLSECYSTPEAAQAAKEAKK